MMYGLFDVAPSLAHAHWLAELQESGTEISGGVSRRYFQDQANPVVHPIEYTSS